MSKTFCYINLTKNIPTRDVVYLRGLEENGSKIIECRDDSPGLKKFWVIFKKHWKIRNDYDIVWVGFCGHILVTFAKLISTKKIIFNAAGSMYEGLIISRRQASRLSFKSAWVWLIDYLTFHSADLSLVESNEQKKWLMKKFFLKESKLYRSWTGADDTKLFFDPSVNKLATFTVLFRGGLLPESGIEYVIEAARILKNEDINFRILGGGLEAGRVASLLSKYDLSKVEWMSGRLDQSELRIKMQECHLSLGQLSKHDRLNRTIPHKAFESLAMKLPYLTARNLAILELLKENENCFCCNPADANDLAKKILELRANPELMKKISDNAYKLYSEQLTPKILAKNISNLI